MIQLLEIPHRLPGMNDIAWTDKWAFRQLKAITEESIAVEIRNQGLKKMKFAYVSFIWFEENTKRDPDNICAGAKFCLDALVNCKILPNDGWEHVLGIKHGFVCSPGESRVQITLTDKEGA